MSVWHLALGLGVGYPAAGAIFAVAFLASGIGGIDPAARGSSLGFRLLVAPGVVALWPVLALRWIAAGRRRSSPPEER